MRTTTVEGEQGGVVTGAGPAAAAVLAALLAFSGCNGEPSDARATSGDPEAEAEPHESSSELLAQGRRLLASGELPDARLALERSLELDPTVPEAYAALAEIERSEGRARAEDEARDAVDFWMRVAGRGPAVKPNPKTAEDSFKEGQRQLGDASISLGYQAVDRNRLALALQAFEGAVDFDPTNAEYHFYAGYAWSLKHEYDRAVARLRQAAQLDPKRADAPTALGVIRLAQGRADEARQMFERALRLDEENATLQYQFGTCLEQLGEDVPACRAYERAALLDPVEVEPYLRLGNLLPRLGREQMGERRLADFEWWTNERNLFDAWAADRRRLPADKLAGWTVYLEGRADEEGAEERIMRALTHVLTARKEYAEAQTWMQRSLSKRKRNVKLLTDYAAVCDHMGDVDQARLFLVRAMKIDPDDVEVRIEHAAHLAEFGRTKEAHDQFVEIAEGNPDNAWVRYSLEELDGK